MSRDVSLTNFKNEIENIREYIKYINLVNSIDNKSEVPSVTELYDYLCKFSIQKKVFEYKSIVMSIYGILEKYISIWIKEHTETISNFNIEYDKLPEKFQESHFSLSISLISNIIDGKNSKYESLNKEKVLNTLNECILKSNYKLNSEAFFPTSGNLKHVKVVEAFKPFGINTTKSLKGNLTFREYLENKYGSNIANRGNELFNIIDDIVIRRNDVAHGEDIDDIFNVESFYDYLEYLENYGTAIFESIIQKEIEYECDYFYERLSVVHGVFCKGSVLCFAVENNELNVGDFIICKNSDSHFIKNKIMEIRIDKDSYNHLVFKDSTDVGVLLNNTISKNNEFYIKSAI
ncbi:MAE_28990/MAE_18760 family HEPN-like nuclease [Photobacterium damselae]|uniref:MAE_28990/MAE_18760 family HEPN-like nuclease n=1 Tax=Photobacterium damselae TaxID=38293 RepID=UPI00254302CB